MRMKKLVVLGLTVLILFSFTGCGSDIKLSKEDNDLVAEYIAGVILKYSYENEWEYQKLRNSALLTPQSSTSQSSGTSASNGNDISSAGASSGQTQGSADVMESMAEVLGLTGTTIKYKTYQVGERYPQDEFAVCVPANNGCSVLALEFDIVNSSSSAITANTASKAVSLKLSVGGETVTASATLLKNDLLGLNDVTIAANSTYTAAVVFQVPEAAAQNISGMSASVYINGTSVGQIPGL